MVTHFSVNICFEKNLEYFGWWVGGKQSLTAETSASKSKPFF